MCIRDSYMDPHNNDALASREALEYWSPVDWYNGCLLYTSYADLRARYYGGRTSEQTAGEP